MKLFTIGDSISQGFMSGAAARTDLCYSTLIAQVMQLEGAEYAYPNVWHKGGLPLNLEVVLRRLSEEFGSDISGLDWLRLAPVIDSVLNEVERYFEQGERAENKSDPSGAKFYHNVAVQGFDLADAWLITPDICQKEIARSNDKGENRDGFLALPNADFYRIALKVLNPSLDPAFKQCSQLEWLRKHATETPAGVENLILWLGANNALGTVFKLSINQTPNDPNRSLLHLSREDRERWNLWHPNDFEAEYQELLDQVSQIMRANQNPDWNVFIGTIPLVTIPPLTRGVGNTTLIEIEPDYEVEDDQEKPEMVYYKYYTHFFRDEAAIIETDRAYLTLFDVLHIDDCIRQYNRIIRKLVAKANRLLPQDRFHIVDMSKALQQISFTRNAGKVQYQFPEFFRFQYPRVNTKYYHADQQGRLRQGGLFSLDGIHPSAIGQGLIAYEFLKVMQKSGARNCDPAKLNWKQIFASDTLYNNPIPIMGELYDNKKLAEFVIDRIAKQRFKTRRIESNVRD